MPQTNTGVSSSRPIQQRPSNAARPRNAVTAQQQQQQAAAQQPPWRSSLDLVWSYSRSQAFYSHNLETSPSFTDARWRGPQYEVTPEVLEEGDEEEDEYDWDQGDAESDGADEDRGRASPDQETDHLFPHTGPVWSDDTAPYSATSSTGSGSSKLRRVRQVAAEGTDSDDRDSRSRSRSPKRLDISRPTASDARKDRRASGLSRRETEAEAGKASADATPETTADERTPLISTQDRRKSRSSVTGMGGIRRKSSGTALLLNVPKGSSTFGQSLFNSINALVGVGILSLPLALSYASFTLGIPLFLAAGLLTSYTGKLLWKMMRLDPRLRSYTDIGRYAFGDRAQIGISLLFGAELWAVSVALIILFGDSLYALVHSNKRPHAIHGLVISYGLESWSPTSFKILGFVLVLPTVFMPLRFLSPISVIGILSTVTVLIVLVTDGLLKETSPGSLHDPAVSIWPPEPPQWSKVPLSFGLIMSGFASHAIVPAIIRDMQEPEHFPSMFNTAYFIATAIYLTMGVTGYFMFGRDVSDEITRDVARIKEYPHILTQVAVWLIVVVPLTKFALASRPFMGIFEALFGVDEVPSSPRAEGVEGDSSAAAVVLTEELAQGVSDSSPAQGALKRQISDASVSRDNASSATALPVSASSKVSPKLRTVLRNLLRLLLTVVILMTAILLPEFERIMAFLGAFLAFTTCVIGPVLAHLKCFHQELSTRRIVGEIALLSISAICAIIGTVWAFLPL